MEDNDKHAYLAEELIEVAARMNEYNQIECSFELWLLLITYAFKILSKSPRNIFIRIIGFLLFVALSFMLPITVVFVIVHNMFVDIKAFLFNFADLD